MQNYVIETIEQTKMLVFCLQQTQMQFLCRVRKITLLLFVEVNRLTF